MRRTLLFTALLAIGLAAVSFRAAVGARANWEMAARIRNEGFNNSKVMQTLFLLTDVNGPRLTGSAGMRRAEDWVRTQFSDWGLQHAHIEAWGGFGKGWEINKVYVAMTAPYYQALIAVPRAWTPGTNGPVSGNATLVKVENVADMAQYAGKLRGKIVVLNTISMETKINFNADATRLTQQELDNVTKDPHLEDGPTNLSQKPKPPTKAYVNFRKQIDSFLYAEGALAVVSGGRGTMGTLFTSNGASRAWDAPM
ncbi:MAG: peptidase M28, partial [Chitinophagia bacterium]|nr:peptidase M28 [Chitinophagia bacterium]